VDLFNRIRQAKAPSGLETGRGALAGGDDDDGGVDRRASGDGYAGLSEPSLVLYRRRKLSEEYPISRTDPFMTLLPLPLYSFTDPVPNNPVVQPMLKDAMHFTWQVYSF